MIQQDVTRLTTQGYSNIVISEIIEEYVRRRNSRSTAKYKRSSISTECIRDRNKPTFVITPFQLTRDSIDTAVCWAKWKKNSERQFRFFGIEDPQLKKDGLYYGGQENTRPNS